VSRRIARFGTGLKFSIGLLLAAATASAADSILLKPRLEPPADVYIEAAVESVQKMTGPDGKPMQIQSRALYGVLGKAAAAGEGSELHGTLDRLSGSFLIQSGPGGEGMKSGYDTDDPENEDASPDHKAAFGPLLNQPLTITLDAQGVATAVQGAETLREKLRSLGQQNFIAKSLADEDFSDRQVMSVFGELPLVLYPHRDVKVGEAWHITRHDHWPQVGRIIVTYECALDRIEGAGDDRAALVRYKGAIAKDPNEQPAQDERLGTIDGSFTGTARFLPAQGRFVEIRRETKAQIGIPQWWRRDPNAPLMQIEGQYDAQYRTTPTADRLKQKQEIAKRVADARVQREKEEAAALSGPVEPVTPQNAPVPWLQWGGPLRNFCSDATGLANRWPKDGPPRVWERPLGDGYSAILCDGEALYTMYSERHKDDPFTGDEVIVALDASTGRTLWEHRYPAPWPKGLQMEFGPGPHSTPIVVGDRVFGVGCTAQVHCLDKKTGRVIWSKDLLTEFNAVLHGRGYGSSPLAYKGYILLPVSGEDGRAVMAFAQADGSVAWQGGEFQPGYASLLLIDAFGSEQLVAFTGTSLNGLDPSSGKTLWSVEHPTQFGANISTPLWHPQDQHLFISSAYGMGSRGVKLERNGDGIAAREVWYNNKMKIQHGDAVRVEDWVYGSSGDFGPTFLCCVNARTGEFGWKQRGIGKANVVYADGKLIVLDEEGTLLLVKADPAQYRVLAKVGGLCQKTAWTVPTLYGRTLYLRDRAKIMALDLGGDVGRPG
jgi:outer membrane protein assembly factor BamB